MSSLGDGYFKRKQSLLLSINSVPPFRVRYLNAIKSIGFIITMTGLLEYITSKQLKSSTPYKYSLALVKQSPEVQQVLGVPIKEGITVRSKRNENQFLLTYTVSGPLSKATVEALSISKPKSTTLVYLGVKTKNGQLILTDKKSKNEI